MPQHFIEPENSLPFSQKPATNPCPEQGHSSQQHPILFSEGKF
jgi:hypothetical protein